MSIENKHNELLSDAYKDGIRKKWNKDFIYLKMRMKI